MTDWVKHLVTAWRNNASDSKPEWKHSEFMKGWEEGYTAALKNCAMELEAALKVSE